MSTTTKMNPVEDFRNQLQRYTREFGAALPSHIPLERFMRVVLTAVNFDPDLLMADRASLFESALKAAQDGLLPDKRDGAFVVFNTKVKRDGVEKWIKKVQWMPMVFGILKKVRNSGQLATLTSRVVYAGDKYRYWIDEKGEHLEYEPGDDQDTNLMRFVFALAVTKDGASYIEHMTVRDVERTRAVSKSKDRGPWVDWYDEMAKKTAIRRLAKRLPMSSDLDDLVRRDDTIYDFDDKSSATTDLATQMFSVRNPLDDDDGSDAAGGSGSPAAGQTATDRVDQETGEVTKTEQVGPKQQPADTGAGPETAAPSQTASAPSQQQNAAASPPQAAAAGPGGAASMPGSPPAGTQSPAAKSGRSGLFTGDE